MEHVNSWLLVAGFIITTFVVWIVFDVWLGSNGFPTESTVIKTWGKRSTFFAWLLGFLVGHWFFGVQTPWLQGWRYAVGVMAALIGWDLWWHFKRGPVEPFYPWYRYPGWWVLVGIPCGMYLWGQINVDAPL